jgi:hypothetical protein
LAFRAFFVSEEALAVDALVLMRYFRGLRNCCQLATGAVYSALAAAAILSGVMLPIR